jgi:protein gp37
MKMAARLEAMGVEHYRGLTQKSKAGAVWTGKVALAPEKILLEPLRRKKPTTYFVNSMGDLFHKDVPDEWIDMVFAVMALCPQHTFQILSKRACRMRSYISSPDMRGRIDRAAQSLNWFVDSPHDGCYLGMTGKWPGWPLPNVWAGVSAEDHPRR